MTKDEIRALLNDLESDRVERTIGKIQPQPSMAVEKVSMDEGDIVNTTVGNASIWSLLLSKK